jgi:hypothetical protein
MFALLALITFVIVLFDGTVGSIDLVVLGLAFLSAHFVFPITLPMPRFVARQRAPE